MTGAIVTAIGATIAALFTFLAFLIKRRDARKDPVARSTAELALAKEALGIIQSSRDALKDDVTRLIEARRQDRARIDADQARIDGLEIEVRSIREGWQSWYRDLVDRWAHHREQPRPPRPPDLG